MAEERNIHVKMAMVEPLGCLLIAWIAFQVAMAGFDSFAVTSAAVMSVMSIVGIGLIILAFLAFWQENLLCTIVFGPLGVFFATFPSWALTPGAWAATMMIGIILLLAMIVSLLQPVRLLPVLLFFAFLLFIVLGMWLNTNPLDHSIQQVWGVMATIVFLLALYLGTAVSLLVMKGKEVLPLLIKK
ncbi:MAG: hypothetical protein LUO79_04260 [Methanomassiliicoccales archaeon]|nr:hypothetical protein [Methanomassiliicoccales archaeon]